MRVVFRYRDNSGLQELLDRGRAIDKKKITVGPQGSRNRDLAKIHEYGVTITVTPAMRGFLASKGLHLKQSTTYITIPERSFIRAGWDDNAWVLLNDVEVRIVDYVNGRGSVENFLGTTGDKVARAIRAFARDLENPANHPFTVEQKGYDDPLIESGQMVRSIDYEIE